MVEFHRSLSVDTVYARYFANLGLDQRIAHDRLVRICFGDYDRELALVAEYREEGAEEPEIAAVGRLSKSHGGNTAEFAILVSDRFQHRGLGPELLERLIAAAKAEGLEKLLAEILPTNGAMIRIAQEEGFALTTDPSDGTVHAELALR